MFPTAIFSPPLERHHARVVAEAVPPFRRTRIRQIHPRPGAVRELTGARNEVGVDVGFRHTDDAHPLGFRRGDVLVASRLGSTTKASPVAWQPIR
jgi:hypothetical protein